jgi:hypothetical protein
MQGFQLTWAPPGHSRWPNGQTWGLCSKIDTGTKMIMPRRAAAQSCLREVDQVVFTRIDWVREHCRLLRGIADEFGRTRPFDGLTIGTGIHLEAKTVALLLTLRDGGARLVSTGNLNTTQPDAAGRLRAEGVTVIGGADQGQPGPRGLPRRGAGRRA